MPLFKYQGFDEKGNAISGTVEAVSREVLIKTLAAKGEFPTKISEEETTTKEQDKTTTLVKSRKISREEIEVFTTQLAAMLKAGVALASSIQDLAENTENLKLKKILLNIQQSLLTGKSFSESLMGFPKVFPAVYLNMVRAGETGGKLPEVLKRLSLTIKREVELINKIKTALTYPLVLTLVALAVITFILTNFVPKFIDIFKKMSIPLPLPTFILYKTSLYFKILFFPLLAILVILIFILKAFLNTRTGKTIYDEIVLNLPFLGNLHLKVCALRFLQTLGTLYSSGVPILEAINIAKDTLNNIILEKRISAIIGNISKGEDLSSTFKKTNIFSPLVLRMINTGEKSGSLQQMLSNSADFYDVEIETTLQRLTALLEPMILLIMGSLVAFIMASTLMPMFQMIRLMRKG